MNRSRRHLWLAPVLGLTLAVPLAAPAVASPAAPTRAERAADWRVVPLPSAESSGDTEMLDVECHDSTCLMLQRIGGGHGGIPALVTMEGRRATVARIPADPGTTAQALSCPTHDWCMAVGHVHTEAPSDRTWAATFDGRRWRTVPTPTPTNGAGGQGYLFDVSCTSTSWCIAGGWYWDDAAKQRGLLLRWDGQRWRRIEAQHLMNTALRSMDCVARERCIVVGNDTVRGGMRIQRWTGDAWRSVGGLPAGFGQSQGNAVECRTLGDCLIAGRVASGQGLVLRLDGRQARVVPLPSGGVGTDELNDVSCPTRGACMAVGGTNESPTRGSIVRITSNDRTTVSPAWRPGSAGSRLMAVSCDERCVAVGQGNDLSFTLVPFALVQP